MAELNRRNIHDVANAFHFNTVERILTLVMSSGLRETFLLCRDGVNPVKEAVGIFLYLMVAIGSVENGTEG